MPKLPGKKGEEGYKDERTIRLEHRNAKKVAAAGAAAAAGARGHRRTSSAEGLKALLASSPTNPRRSSSLDSAQQTSDGPETNKSAGGNGRVNTTAVRHQGAPSRHAAQQACEQLGTTNQDENTSDDAAIPPPFVCASGLVFPSDITYEYDEKNRKE